MLGAFLARPARVSRTFAFSLFFLFLGFHHSIASALTISDVVLTPSDHSFTATWTTDQPSNTRVEYNSGSSFLGDNVTSHSLTILGLDPQTTYQVTVQSETTSGSSASAGPFSLTTLTDTTAPVVGRVTVNSVTSRSATLTVHVSEPAGTATAEYGPTQAYGQTATSQISEQTGYERDSWVIVSGLTPSMHLQLQVRADDGYGNTSDAVGNYTLTTDTLWDQAAFEPDARLYLQTCVAVGDADGCTPSASGNTRYRYTWPKEMSWTGNELLVHFNAEADDLTRGDLLLDLGVKEVQRINDKWVVLEIAVGASPATLTVVNPGGMMLDRSGSYLLTIPSNLFSPGLNYVRLRGTSITAAEMGYGRTAPTAVWSRMRLRFTDQQPPVLTDDQLLDRTQAQAARYFWEQAFNTNGFVRDLTNSSEASIAATGFGLAALAIMAERYGSSPEWTVTPDEARNRAQTVLQAAVDIQSQQAGDSEHYGKAGFLYHFIEPDGRRYRNRLGSGLDSTIEVSTVDTALFAAGAIVAGQYFGGEVRASADQFLANLDWNYFYDAAVGRFHHSWRPEYLNGTTVTSPDGDGYLSNLRWDRPTDEVLLINLLALARQPSSAAFHESLYRWPRLTRSYAGYDVVNSFFGSLFTYFFAQGFVDFAALGPDNPAGAGSAEPSVNWFLNAKSAALANRQFAIANAPGFPSYSAERWGLSAAYAPSGAYIGDNGAKPTECNYNPDTGVCGATPPAPQNGEPHHDGTVPPYGAISAMPLVRTTGEVLSDNLGFQALRHYHDAHFSGLWGPYGPRDSLAIRIPGQPTYSPLYVGIDAGPQVLLIEQYRSGLPARLVMGHAGIDAALHLQFPGYTNHPPVVDAGADQAVPINTVVTLDGCASSDPDGDSLSFVWRRLDGQLLGTTCQVAVPASSVETSQTYRLAVSDSVITVVGQVVVTWEASPPPPTITITVPALGSVVNRTQPILVQGVATAAVGTLIQSIHFRVDDVTNQPPTFVIDRIIMAIPSREVWNWGSEIYANAAAGHKLRVQVTASTGTTTSNPATIYINPDGTVASCYILTAAYGTPYAADIQALNALRERFVPMGKWHQAYLHWYDRQGPRMAAIVRRHPFLQGLIRGLAKPAAAFARWRLQISQ